VKRTLRWIPMVLVLLSAPIFIAAQEHSSMRMASLEPKAPGTEQVPATLLPGMGSLHHPIATKNPEAQRFFDQGLTFFYAFNFDEAVRSFKRASQLDPLAAMPYWGLALALGPNYNFGTYVIPANEKAAYEAIQQAAGLAASGPDAEKDYIAALGKLFSNDSDPDLAKLSHDYIPAARDLSLRYPDDPDAGTLYAAGMMNLHTRALWKNDGKPGEDTLAVVAELERVLRLWPDHVGANHYYIHAMEASPFPERALPSAHRLEMLVPAAGHLVHMPAHLYVRTGEYVAAVKSNLAAVAIDQEYLRDLATTNMGYKLGYAEHNLGFLVFSASMDGEFEVAMKAAKELESQGHALVAQMPPTEGYMAPALLLELRFAQWDRILALPAPEEKLEGMTFFWHYARGCAFAVKEQPEKAVAELGAMEQIYKDLPAGPAFGMMPNSWSAMQDMASRSLEARISVARGDFAGAAEHWRAAITAEDNMRYHEPPDWYYPMRESLGAMFFRSGKFADAEKVFREDLDRNPRNPRSLFGLWKTLDAERKPAEADLVRRIFDASWKGGADQLRMEDF
jgi:tetratricopeptide (TPR) repeat protein